MRAELLLKPKAKQIVGDLIFEAQRCKDPTLRTALYAAAQNLSDLNHERFRLASMIVALLKQLGGNVLIEKRHYESIDPNDEFLATEGLDHIALRLKGAGLLVS